MSRPVRLRLPDFAGRQFTLPDGAESWQEIGRSDADHCLVLGLGPLGSGPVARIMSGAPVYWLDRDDNLAAISGKPPSHWRRVDLQEALELAPHCRVYFYAPNLRLQPRFWHHVRSVVEWTLLKDQFHPDDRMIWLPGDSSMLLHQELLLALRDRQYNVVTGLPSSELSLLQIWGHRLPRYVLSVNLRGLDGAGTIFGICQAAGVPVAIWFVDNIWNQLSAVPLPWWKDAWIFVSDGSFIPSLKALGARNVEFLPLAASGHFFDARGGMGGGSPLFVGRSSFPGRDSYFANCHIEPALLETALAMSERSQRPDFFWWDAQYQAQLWPGSGSRLPAYGAELCSERRRALWLMAALPHGLEVVGGDDWKKWLPDASVSPPVDYYGALPQLYADALCCLNVTSLLLPGSLNQRHFDVWAAGGFLLTDRTTGLNIFPEALTRWSVLEKREDFGTKVEWLRKHTTVRREIIGEWRELILAEHLYGHRLAALEKALFPA